MSNRFDGVEKESIHNLIAQTVGAGSSPVLWMSEGNEVDGDGLYATQDKYGRPCIFQDRLANQIVSESMEKLKEMLIDRLAKSGALDADDCEFLVGVILDEEE